MSRELALLGRILQLASDRAVRLEEFERCLSASPPLAAEVVRIAGSDLFGMEARIHTLQRAVLILGVALVASIAAAVVARRELTREERWRHSLEIAVCSEEIARCLGLDLGPEAFRAGLLHDLGTPSMQCERWAHPGAPLAALVAAAHAIVEPGAAGETAPSAGEAARALADLDLHPDDVSAVRAVLAARVKQLSERL